MGSIVVIMPSHTAQPITSKPILVHSWKTCKQHHHQNDIFLYCHRTIHSISFHSWSAKAPLMAIIIWVSLLMMHGPSCIFVTKRGTLPRPWRSQQSRISAISLQYQKTNQVKCISAATRPIAWECCRARVPACFSISINRGARLASQWFSLAWSCGVHTHRCFSFSGVTS